MPKQYLSGAPLQLAREMSAELAPHRLPKEVHRRAAQPFVNGVVRAVGGMEGVAREAAVEGMANARRAQLRAWVAARAHIFLKAGCEARLEGIDGLVLRCKSCLTERVLVAGIMPSVSEMACPRCSPKG